MTKSKSRIKRETLQAGDTAEDTLDAAKDNDSRPSARASTPPPKKPATVSEVQELPDCTPQITVVNFTRGTGDPILRAFAVHEKLTHGIRKLTRQGWTAEYEAFRKASR